MRAKYKYFRKKGLRRVFIYIPSLKELLTVFLRKKEFNPQERSGINESILRGEKVYVWGSLNKPCIYIKKQQQ